jgi:GPH family glycoside/pentoside/hexuronide:cation symporter
MATEGIGAILAGRPPGKLTIGLKTGFGVGQFVDGLSSTLLNSFFFFYMTNVCGLATSLTGLAVFVALAIDSVADPLIGSFSDNLRTRWGRRVPPMALSLVPMAASLGLLFSIPHTPSGLPLFLHVLALLIALRISLSAFLIPYMGLGAELTADYDERSSVVAFRAIFGMVGTLAGYGLGFGVFLHGPKGLLDGQGYLGLSWTCALALFATGAFATGASLHALPRVVHPSGSDRHLAARLIAEIGEVFRNRSFNVLFLGVLMFFVGQGVWLALMLDGGKYFWGLSVAEIQGIALALVAGIAAGLPVAFLLIGRVEKRTVVLLGIGVICMAQSLPIAAEFLGWLPAASPVRVPVLLGASVLIGACFTVVSVSFQSAMADAVDEHEHLFAARREGLYFASLSFASKAALGAGSLITGLLLSAIHFPSEQIAAGTVITIAPAVQHNLGWVYGPGAAVITLLCLIFFSRYRLNRAGHARILRALGR